MALIPSDGAVAFIPQAGHMPTDEKDTSAIDSIIDITTDDGKRKRWIPVVSMGFSPQQIQDVLPLEIGYQSAMRSGVYKGGVWAAGQMTLIPRIDQDHLHYLFYSLTGSWLGEKKRNWDDHALNFHYYGAGEGFNPDTAVLSTVAGTYTGETGADPETDWYIFVPDDPTVFDEYVIAEKGAGSMYKIAWGTAPDYTAEAYIGEWVDTLDPSLGFHVYSHMQAENRGVICAVGNCPTSGSTDPVDVVSFMGTGGDNLLEDYYMTIQQKLPKPSPLDNPSGLEHGRVFRDVRVGSMSLQLTVGAPVTAQMSFVGRYYKNFKSDTGWVDDSWDTQQPEPLPNNMGFLTGCKGWVKLPVGDTPIALTFSDLQILVGANLTTPQQMMVLFNYYPEEFRILERTVILTATVRNHLSELESLIYNAGGDEWSPTPWRNGEPVLINVQTGFDDLVADVAPADMTFWFNDVAWVLTPITYVAGRLTEAQLTGVVMGASIPPSYWMRITNEMVTDDPLYGPWPTSP